MSNIYSQLQTIPCMHTQANTTTHTHMSLAASKDGIGAHPISLPFSITPLLFPVFFLIQSPVLSCQHNSSSIHIFLSDSVMASTCTHMHSLSPTPPTLSLGCLSISVGGERHPCFAPLCNHILFLLPLQSQRVLQTHPIPATLHLQVFPRSRPTGTEFFFTSQQGV